MISLFAFVLPGLLIPAPARAAGLDTTGRWTDTTSARRWHHMQIHVALLRGDAAYHSKIVSWGYYDHTLGKLGASFWGWNPGATSGDNDCSTYPATQFDSLYLDLTNIPSLFCAGHATLADGNLLVSGGDDGAEVGLRDSYLFRPNPTAGQTRWTRQGDMEQERWYPSNVALPDGNMMVFAGGRFSQMVAFGGTQTPLSSSSNTRRDVERLGLTGSGRWQSMIPYDGTSNWPGQREGHSAVWFPLVKQVVIFGGRGDGNGSTKYNNLYRLRLNTRYWGNELADRYEYVWKPISPSGQLPFKRDRHSAVMRNDNAMLVYGGRDTSGTLSDVMQLSAQIVVTPPDTTWAWSLITPTGTSPGARYGHAAVMDAAGNRMLVFGGRNSSGVVNDQAVYALSATNVWSTLTLTAGSPRPAAREGHTWVADPFLRNSPLASDPSDTTDDRRFVLFGGKNSAGARQKDTWALWIHNDGSAEWQQLPDAPAGMQAVTRHAALWDLTETHAEHTHDRMLVFGGESADSAVGSVWEMDGDTLSAPRWTRRANHPLLALAGQTALFYHSPNREVKTLDALKVEEYNPTSGTWTVRDTAQWLWAYPHVFLLPSGNIFYSGPDAYSLRYTRTETQARWLAVDNDTIFGDAAVMYRPDAILRSGNPPKVPNYPITGTAQRIAFSGTDATSGWQSAGTMMGRNNHNLTVLPNGRVLVTGGLVGEDIHENKTNNPPVRRPQMWDPAVPGVWSDSSGSNALAEDPAKRSYHSTAILLPDGRVMTAGGEVPAQNDSGYNLNWDRPTIFCPPYLFNPGGSLAIRPTIYAWHDALGYSQTFTLLTESPDSIVSICLIRPGAVTHGFAQDQRYVPIPFTVVQEPGYCAEIHATTPANANLAPPGDYLLFINKKNPFDATVQVPSVAQWVRLREGINGPLTGYAPPGCGGGGCPMVDNFTGSGWQGENSILGRSLTGALAFDSYRLKAAPEDLDGRYRLRIRENEQEQTTLDQARLLAVDHAPGVRAFATSQGFVLGERRAAYRVTTAAGADVTALVNGSGRMFQGRRGDVLLVDMTAPGEVGAALRDRDGPALYEFPCCEKLGPQPGGGFRAQSLLPAAIDAAVLNQSGILVQVPEPSGGWRTIQHLYARAQADEAVVDSTGQGRLRLVFVGPHRLRFIGRVARIGAVVPQALPLLSARHSRLGDAVRAIANSGGETTMLVPGDTLALEFGASAVPAGQGRDFFLVARGVYTAWRSSDQPQVGSAVPSRFALLQNQPNPFATSTTIRFELPVAAHVKLEVFDLLGRRVATLAEGEYPAGTHAVDWNRRAGSGAAAPPGVYLYRLRAGSYRERKKMVLLP